MGKFAHFKTPLQNTKIKGRPESLPYGVHSSFSAI